MEFFFMILADFFGFPDPDPADQNETDPDPKHCLKTSDFNFFPYFVLH